MLLAAFLPYPEGLLVIPIKPRDGLLRAVYVFIDNCVNNILRERDNYIRPRLVANIVFCIRGNKRIPNFNIGKPRAAR